MKISQISVCICVLALGGAISLHAEDNAAQAAARAALEKALNGTDSSTPAPQTSAPAATPAPAEVAPATQPTPPPSVAQPEPVVVTAPAAAPATNSDGDTEAQAKARAALVEKLDTLPATAAPAQAPAAKPAKAKGSTPQPVVAPALPMGKEQKLQALLNQYKADQITPEQYHEQRAAIISGN